MKALIHDTRVCQIEEETFPVHRDLVWVDCDETITLEHTYVGGQFVDPISWSPDVQWKVLRDMRDGLLMVSDWTQMSDVTIDNKAAWATYRQELRDLPANTADPANPIWPEKV
jgi:hypothetical protein